MWYCVPAGQGGILGYLLDSRLRGNDMSGLAHLAGASCFIWLTLDFESLYEHLPLGGIGGNLLVGQPTDFGDV